MPDPTHVVLLVLHAVAGSVALLLGPVAIVRETRRLAGGSAHPTDRVSDAYDAAVLTVCVSAVVLVVLFRGDLAWLVALSAFSFGLVVLARRALARRHRGWTHAYVHGRGGSYISQVTAFVVVALTVDGPVTGWAELVPWLLPTVVGTVLVERWRGRVVPPAREHCSV